MRNWKRSKMLFPKDREQQGKAVLLPEESTQTAQDKLGRPPSVWRQVSPLTGACRGGWFLRPRRLGGLARSIRAQKQMGNHGHFCNTYSGIALIKLNGSDF